MSNFHCKLVNSNFTSESFSPDVSFTGVYILEYSLPPGGGEFFKQNFLGKDINKYKNAGIFTPPHIFPQRFFPLYIHFILPFLYFPLPFPISPLLFPQLLILIEKYQNLRVNNGKRIQILLTRKEKYSKLQLYTSLVLCHLFMYDIQ